MKELIKIATSSQFNLMVLTGFSLALSVVLAIILLAIVCKRFPVVYEFIFEENENE